MEEGKISNTWRKALLVISCVFLVIGACGCPLLLRLYFIKGGKTLWFSSWIQAAGFPIILIPLIIAYFRRRRNSQKMVTMKLPVFIASAVIGLISGLGNYFITVGFSRLPVSTAAIVTATQLGYTALFAFLLVKQKFTSYSINAVVLLTVGAAVLALHTSGDRPEGESDKMYAVGFVMTLAASALFGLMLPMVQLMYMKAKQAITVTLVLEVQLVICFFATAFCTVGVLVNRDLQAIRGEAREYELGEGKYYLVVIGITITAQFYGLGGIGIVSCASSLLSGIMNAVLIPVTEILALFLFTEKFRPEKGVALFLSLWGFVSYFYGEIKHGKEKEKSVEVMSDAEMTQMAVP